MVESTNRKVVRISRAPRWAPCAFTRTDILTSWHRLFPEAYSESCQTFKRECLTKRKSSKTLSWMADRVSDTSFFPNQENVWRLSQLRCLSDNFDKHSFVFKVWYPNKLNIFLKTMQPVAKILKKPQNCMGTQPSPQSPLQKYFLALRK